MEKHQDIPSIIDRDTKSLEPLLPEEHVISGPKRMSLSRLSLFAVKILTLTLLVTITIYKYFSSSLSPPSLYAVSLRVIPPVELQHTQSAYEARCGNSPAEARKLGCRFDMITFSWQHKDCWDETLYMHFLTRYKNTWYWETLDGEPVPVDEVLAGHHQVLNTTWGFYIVHCLYAMERAAQGSPPSRLTRVGARRQLLEDWSPPYLHAKQCMLDLMNPGRYARTTMMTTTRMWYPACEPISAN
ncbi:hypothetical protein RJZ56_000957 [Blastomyces dermatitidis]|uniref:Uncharacterized protein n=3 Tax=Blastomyces TaxID=229219 RepID=A0A179UCL4_BLAGS|nr:uncharacterized protein BDBG_02068 [Blastomyces gilchristii SLH14081]XP_045275520.1 uncharacterized protein BDCG_03496 [Blastomyces dermatitidis ER-3]EGE77459.1 hypothetical protein BDDG_00396 [Blastomyces dermatitidis ATCC 18188]EQL38420.1 hypothetical protein BDFG_00033 [Blastomyces dermatitidis ATCC 26199]EEQ88376.1 hypothetical protein BDCG_03496 [Blastomyces dermatitidis ER-3]OAT05726.1 hypothetical protein BDBG_02068 [Blastomyces gilchristii SLH14081]